MCIRDSRKPARTMGISVPVHCQAQIAATLTVVWDASYAGVDAFASSHLPAMQKTAAAIGNRLTTLTEAYRIALPRRPAGTLQPAP